MFDELGNIVKTTRLDKHLTQKQLAKRLSITPHYLMSIENKGKIPSCKLLYRIVRELEIPADTIFYPEYRCDCISTKKLQVLLRKCDEKDITVIMATLQSFLQAKNSDGR